MTNSSNNEIIETWTPTLLSALQESENAWNIKHNRNRPPLKPTAKFHKEEGEINRIGININRGLVMTSKGKGMYQDRGNRQVKDFFNPVTDKKVSELADEIAEHTGDIIAGHIHIR